MKYDISVETQLCLEPKISLKVNSLILEPKNQAKNISVVQQSSSIKN